jgi:hypothetical protein
MKSRGAANAMLTLSDQGVLNPMVAYRSVCFYYCHQAAGCHLGVGGLREIAMDLNDRVTLGRIRHRQQTHTEGSRPIDPERLSLCCR